MCGLVFTWRMPGAPVNPGGRHSCRRNPHREDAGEEGFPKDSEAGKAPVIGPGVASRTLGFSFKPKKRGNGQECPRASIGLFRRKVSISATAPRGQLPGTGRSRAGGNPVLQGDFRLTAEPDTVITAIQSPLENPVLVCRDWGLPPAGAGYAIAFSTCNRSRGRLRFSPPRIHARVAQR
jgi:hypothetical protein